MKTTIGILILLLSFSLLGRAQIIDVKGKIKNQSTNRANQRTDQGIDKGLDKVEEGVVSIFKGGKKDKKSKDESDTKTSEDESNDSKSDSKKSDDTKLEAYSKYDFVPGDKIILYEDFSQDAVGDFPALWTTNQSGEINTLNVAPGNWFNLNSTEGNWWFLNEIDFPKNFIIDFDIVPKKEGGRFAAIVAMYGENGYKEMGNLYEDFTTALHVNIATEYWETSGYKQGMDRIQGTSNINPVVREKANHVIIWVQNRRVRIYHQGAKVLDMPTNLYDGSKFTRLAFTLPRGASCSSWIGNIKITTASPDTRSKLLEEGKLVSYGIYFDVNKDVVKPESYGALNDIAKVLKENPDVRVKIVGHTDADGADAVNLDLSKRRGEAVKKELVKTFGIDEKRLESDGLGESQPIAPNDTPSNKALNRRVEFIKL